MYILTNEVAAGPEDSIAERIQRRPQSPTPGLLQEGIRDDDGSLSIAREQSATAMPSVSVEGHVGSSAGSSNSSVTDSEGDTALTQPAEHQAKPRRLGHLRAIFPRLASILVPRRVSSTSLCILKLC